jgi:HSP20 family protein
MWNDEIFEDMRRMQRQMDRMVYGFGPGPLALIQGAQGKELAGQNKFWRTPRCDLCETDKAVVAQFELPGTDKNDIDLNVTDDGIQVKVEKKQEKESKGKGSDQYLSQRQSFYRHIPLPRNVDASKAKAEYKDGMLCVEIPKRALSKVKRLEIK